MSRRRAPRRPSDRAYRALAVAHARAYAEWAQGVLARAIDARIAARRSLRADEDDDDQGDVTAETDIDAIQVEANEAYLIRSALRAAAVLPPSAGGPPIPPRPADVARVLQPAARISLTETRAGILRAGGYGPTVDARLGIAPTSAQLNVIDVAPTVVEIKQIQTFATQGTDLIRRIDMRHLQGLDDLIAQAARSGQRYTQLRDEIVKRTGVSVRRAELIARDQIGKLNAKITQEAQTAAGVESYIWRTANDQRVRGNPAGPYRKSKQDHWGLRDTEHRWDDPPKGAGPYNEPAHPGESIACRCYSEAVLPDDLKRPALGARTSMRQMGPRGSAQNPDAPIIDTSGRTFRNELGQITMDL